MPILCSFSAVRKAATARVAGPSTAEALLLFALALLIALAVWLAPIALPAGYHDFADQRTLAGLPHALDVLSNAAFAVLGVWGLWCLRRGGAAGLPRVQRALAGLLFVGLIGTTVCSALYHLAPDNAALAIDRLGMVLPFAGLLGLAAAERVSARAGIVLLVLVLVAAPYAALLDARTGNMTPWSVLQGGGLVLMLALATQRPLPHGLRFSLLAVVLAYALAKALELADAPVFAFTGGVLSGHSLKHVVAALAVWPVVAALQRAGRAVTGRRRAKHNANPTARPLASNQDLLA